MIKFDKRIPDGSDAGVRYTLRDADDTSVTPSTLNWSLMDRQGNIINNRDSESETPGNPTTILLDEDDTYVEGDRPATRYIKIWGDYDSSVFGVDAQYTEQIELTIESFKDHQ